MEQSALVAVIVEPGVGAVEEGLVNIRSAHDLLRGRIRCRGETPSREVKGIRETEFAIASLPRSPVEVERTRRDHGARVSPPLAAGASAGVESMTASF